MTITSMRNGATDQVRPTAASLFAVLPASQPVAVPASTLGSRHNSGGGDGDDGDAVNYMRTQSFANANEADAAASEGYLSSSAPVPMIRQPHNRNHSSSSGVVAVGGGSNRASLVDSEEAFDFNIEDLDQASTASTTVTGNAAAGSNRTAFPGGKDRDHQFISSKYLTPFAITISSSRLDHQQHRNGAPRARRALREAAPVARTRAPESLSAGPLDKRPASRCRFGAKCRRRQPKHCRPAAR